MGLPTGNTRSRQLVPRNSDGTYRGGKPASFGLILSRNTMSVRIGNRAPACPMSFNPTDSELSQIFPHLPFIWARGEASPLDIASAYSVLPTGAYAPHAVHH